MQRRGAGSIGSFEGVWSSLPFRKGGEGELEAGWGWECLCELKARVLWRTSLATRPFLHPCPHQPRLASVLNLAVSLSQVQTKFSFLWFSLNTDLTPCLYQDLFVTQLVISKHFGQSFHRVPSLSCCNDGFAYLWGSQGTPASSRGGPPSEDAERPGWQMQTRAKERPRAPQRYKEKSLHFWLPRSPHELTRVLFLPTKWYWYYRPTFGMFPPE